MEEFHHSPGNSSIQNNQAGRQFLSPESKTTPEAGSTPWRPHCSPYHGKPNVSFLQRWAIVGPIPGDGHDLPLITDGAVDDSCIGDKQRGEKVSTQGSLQHRLCCKSTRAGQTERLWGREAATGGCCAPTFDKRVLIRRGGAGQHTQLGPDLVQLLLFHLQDMDMSRAGTPRPPFSAPPESTNPKTPRLEAPRFPREAPRGAHLALLVADEPVELLPLQAQEVLPRQQDAALGGDGTGGVDVVPRHHADGDARALALQDGIGHLGTRTERGWVGRVGPRSPSATLPKCSPLLK